MAEDMSTFRVYTTLAPSIRVKANVIRWDQYGLTLGRKLDGKGDDVWTTVATFPFGTLVAVVDEEYEVTD